MEMWLHRTSQVINVASEKSKVDGLESSYETTLMYFLLIYFLLANLVQGPIL